jgi:hypothetical protein
MRHRQDCPLIRSAWTADVTRRHHRRRQTPPMVFPSGCRTTAQTCPVTPQQPSPCVLQDLRRHVPQDAWCWHHTCSLLAIMRSRRTRCPSAVAGGHG